MKRLWSILVVVLLVVSLFGCAEQETVYTVSRNGVEFQVDSVQKTILEGNNTYQYEFSGDASSYEMTITYPNGSSYWFRKSGSGGYGGWSDDYVADAYISGDVLVDIVQEKAPKKVEPGKYIGGIVLIALGLCEIAFPKVLWYIRYGWQYKNAEPSDAALSFARIGGGIVIFMGIVLMLC